MKKLLSLIISVLMISSLLLSLTGCGDSKDVLKSSNEEKTVLMTVGDYTVPLEIYRYAALNHKADYEAAYPDIDWESEAGKALLEQLEEDAKTTVVTLYTTISLAAEYGISPDDTYFTDTLDIMMDNMYENYEYDYNAYVRDLAKLNMNDAVYRFIIRNDLIAEELMTKMIQNGDIVYNEDGITEILNGDGCVRVKQILIADDNGKTDEENLALAGRILEKLENGQDFDELVQKLGEDLYMFGNDDGYYVCRGTLHEAFEEAAFALEIGEISGIVKTDAGYSIIKRYEKDPDYITENLSDLADSYARGQYNLILEAYSKTLTVTETDKMKDYTVFNLESTK